MGRRGTLNGPPKKRDRNADGWELIGFYVQHDGLVDMRDREIAAALKWRDSHGVPDPDRVKTIRAHVTNKSRREREQDLPIEKRTFSGWSFSYRDIKGSPSTLVDIDGALFGTDRAMFALLGDHTRFTQHTSELERAYGHARAFAEQAMGQGRTDLALAWLDYAHDLKTFGEPQAKTVERLKQLLAP